MYNCPSCDHLLVNLNVSRKSRAATRSYISMDILLRGWSRCLSFQKKITINLNSSCSRMSTNYILDDGFGMRQMIPLPTSFRIVIFWIFAGHLRSACRSGNGFLVLMALLSILLKSVRFCCLQLYFRLWLRVLSFEGGLHPGCLVSLDYRRLI